MFCSLVTIWMKSEIGTGIQSKLLLVESHYKKVFSSKTPFKILACELQIREFFHRA